MTVDRQNMMVQASGVSWEGCGPKKVSNKSRYRHGDTHTHTRIANHYLHL